ncbi:hypothetical protein BDF21DRAFT_399529 [Thamnidium elegans]|nr:hypothetical protein BDF21DRAFT_399529 [Thamnidium elegans]
MFSFRVISVSNNGGISDISVNWDTMPDALKESVKSIRPDLAVICTKGVEVGCGELKLLGKAKKLIEIDKARIGEVRKRQLHIKMLDRKSMKEHVTFGIFLAVKQNNKMTIVTIVK